MAHPARDWPEPLLRARAALSKRAQLDESRLLPAYRRYIGGFYQEACTAITAAVGWGAPLIVISGGYGVIRGDELIGKYNRLFHIGDWPPGLLESLLVNEAGRLGVRSVVAFSAATSQYHRPVRRARWHATPAVERVLLVSAAEPGGGSQYFVPRALGKAFRAFWFREPTDAYPPTVTVESLHASTRTGTDATQIARLAELLSDPTRAEPPATFPKDPTAADGPGLYAWWGDQEAVRVISDVLGSRVGNLLYVGQAGATSSVAGKRSNATLLSRIRGQHIRAQTRASTFARTIAAVLREPMQLDLAAPGLLTEHSRQRLSSWICEHLQVAAVPVPAPGALTAVEHAVLAALNPPLNLDGMPRTPQRHRLSELRSRLGHPASSASPYVSRAPASRSSPAPGAQPSGTGFDEVWDRIRRHAGETFILARGQQFSYEVIGNNVLPVGRQRQLHNGNFARAHARMPLRTTTDIKDVQGSSYVFAILTDQRISGP